MSKMIVFDVQIVKLLIININIKMHKEEAGFVSYVQNCL
jgi:hypothetical protein